MDTKWKTYKIRDIGKIITGKTPKTAIIENYGGNIPFLTPSDDLSGKYAPQTAKKITQFGLSEVKNCLLPPNAISVSCIGSDLGKVVKVTIPTVTNQQFNSVIPKEDFDPDFVYYLMTIIGKELNYLSKTSTAVPIVNKTQFSNFDVKIPPLAEQRRIAGILGAIDDKIENNRRINENLEQQAQAIFKSWFVDFEPFKDGNFVSSELGMIPDGWKVGKLGDLCQFKRGKGLLSKNAIPGNVPVVAGGVEPSCYHNVSNTKSPVVTISGSGANAGFMRMYHQEVWASDCSFIDSSCRNFLFVYCFLAINQKLLKHAQTGAVQPHVKPSDIHNFDIIVPTFEIIDEFQNLISDFIMAKGNNQQEISRLVTLRDTLLPKLMSGELIL